MTRRGFLLSLILPVLLLMPATGAAQKKDGQKSCFTAEARAQAERTAKVWRASAGYDPVLGFDPSVGPRKGSPPVDNNGLGRPINCVANKDLPTRSGTN